MPADLESVPTKASLLSWSPSRSSEMSLEHFLAKHDPAKTRTPEGGDGWIWVSVDGVDKKGSQVKVDAVDKGRELLKGLEQRLESIKTDASIPSRKSKTGGPTKAELKQQAISKAKKDLETTAVESGWTSGKWLFFEAAGYASWVFSRLATSLVSGPLSKLKARPHTIKVSTTDGDGMGHNQGKEDKHIICLYFENVWEEEDAKEVLTCILREHGDKPSAAKSDFYTLLDITSKHPSGLRSSQWQPAELVNPSIIEEWVTEGREKRKAAEAEKRGESPGKEKMRRTVADDAFEDEDEVEEVPKPKPKGDSVDQAKEGKATSPSKEVEAPKAASSSAAAAAPKPKSKPPKVSDDNEDEGSATEDEEEPVLLSKPTSTASPQKGSSSSSSSTDGGSGTKQLPSALLAGTKRAAPSSTNGDGASAKGGKAPQRKKVDKYGRGAF